LVANRVEEASRPLREEVASLKLLLARVGVTSEPMEVCSSGGQELATVQASFLVSSAEKSSMVEITLKLHELCAESCVVPELLELGGADVMPPPVKEVMHVVPIDVGVAKSDLLATVPGGVVAREVYDFLATFAATYPGSAVD
jgi:hypothetical protein